MIPQHGEMPGFFNFVQRLRLRAQEKGYRAMGNALWELERTIDKQTDVGVALERLMLQEERLQPQNLELSKEAVRRQIDVHLEKQEEELWDIQARRAEKRVLHELKLHGLTQKLLKAQGLDEPPPKAAPAVRQAELGNELTDLQSQFQPAQKAGDDALMQNLTTKMSPVMAEMDALTRLQIEDFNS